MTAKLKLVGKEPETILPYRRGESASEIAERIRLGVRREPMVQRLGDCPSGTALVGHRAGRASPRAGSRLGHSATIDFRKNNRGAGESNKPPASNS
jgi:hypothetical protein